MNRFSFVFALLTLVSFSYSQNRITLDFETGVRNDLYSLTDQGNQIVNNRPFGLHSGLLISFNVKKIEVETGLSKGWISTIDRFHDFYNFMNSYTAISYLQIPLHIKSPIYIDHLQKLSVAPFIGIASSINLEYFSSMSTGINSFNGSDSLHYVANYINSFRRLFFLSDIGVDVGYSFNNDLQLHFKFMYQQGFTQVASKEMVYSINNDPTQLASQSSKGSNFQYNLGLSYPISNIWDKTKKKKKNEKQFDLAKRQYYISLQSGMQWNKIDCKFLDPYVNTTKGASLFSYATFSAGFDFGINMDYNFQLQSGFNYNVFKHYVNYFLPTGSSTEIMHSFVKYYEIPINIRYQMKLFHSRFYLNPFIGLNIIKSDRDIGEYAQANFIETLVEYDGVNFIEKDSIGIFKSFNYLENESITINSGLDLDIYMSKRLILFLRFQQTFGTQPIDKVYFRFDYHGDITKSEIFYKGTNTKVLFGLKYLI